MCQSGSGAFYSGATERVVLRSEERIARSVPDTALHCSIGSNWLLEGSAALHFLQVYHIPCDELTEEV